MYLLWGLVYIYIYTLIKNIVCLKKESMWLLKNNEYRNENSLSTNIYLLVPMLNEQEIAEDTYLHFMNLIKNRENCYAVFITTEKEEIRNDRMHTYTILKQMQQKYTFPRIKLMHYKEKNGVMAHQLNYAVDEIRREVKHDDFWIGIYNSDSRINSSALDYFEAKVREIGHHYCCFQQYSYYPLPCEVKSTSIISSATLWQNRWSLLFELPRVHFQLKLNKILRKVPSCLKVLRGGIELLCEKLNYIIGHGFFIHNIELEKIGGYPEETINEDAYLGYLLNNERITIYPIPILEQAEFTSRLSVYIKQQCVWFNGPFYALHYAKYYLFGNALAKQRRPLCKKNIYDRIRAIILGFKLFLHAIYWLVSPIILLIILPIFMFFKFGWMGAFIAIIFIMLYLPYVHYLIYRFLKKQYEGVCDIPKPSPIYCVIAYVVHCMGPFLNLYKQIFKKNNLTQKYKTERNAISKKQHAHF